VDYFLPSCDPDGVEKFLVFEFKDGSGKREDRGYEKTLKVFNIIFFFI
jgi:hypothetical protein